MRCTPHRRGKHLFTLEAHLGTWTGLLSLFLKLIVAMPMLYLRSSGNKEHFDSFNFQGENAISYITAKHMKVKARERVNNIQNINNS